MNPINYFIDIHLKLKQFKFQFLFLFLFWFGGFTFFFITEPNQNLWGLIMLSLTVRSPKNGGDFANFYALVLPIFLEVIVFGFIMGELLEKYNPIITSRILAHHNRNHVVIIGYDHLAERIIDYCIENKKTFVVIEDNQELVEDLINSRYPVVIGDPTDIINLKSANITRAKEIFISANDVRISIICSEKIRKINTECSIYVQVAEKHVQDYLKQDPINAFSFSESKWAMNGIQEWAKAKSGNAIIIGRDYLAHRIAHYISLQLGRETFLFDDEHDGIEFEVNPQLHIINNFACFLSDLRPHVNLEEITQAFICWEQESEFDESLYLASKLNLRYPHIELFVRIFDDELVDLVKRYNAKTFSSSIYAFKLLQKHVSPESAIAER